MCKLILSIGDSLKPQKMDLSSMGGLLQSENNQNVFDAICLFSTAYNVYTLDCFFALVFIHISVLVYKSSCVIITYVLNSPFYIVSI